MRVATIEETDDAVIFTFAPDDDAEDSRLIIHKTIPVSYTYQPSTLNAAKTCGESWEAFVASYQDSEIEWTNITEGANA